MCRNFIIQCFYNTHTYTLINTLTPTLKLALTLTQSERERVAAMNKCIIPLVGLIKALRQH